MLISSKTTLSQCFQTFGGQCRSQHIWGIGPVFIFWSWGWITALCVFRRSPDVLHLMFVCVFSSGEEDVGASEPRGSDQARSAEGDLWERLCFHISWPLTLFTGAVLSSDNFPFSVCQTTRSRVPKTPLSCYKFTVNHSFTGLIALI